MYVTGLFVIACALQGVTAPGPGHTKLCRVCPHAVKDHSECLVFQKCKDHCLTDRYEKHHGEHVFTYNCVHELECYMPLGSGPHIHPDHHHEKWTHVCRQCCNSTGCDQFSCAEYLTTTPVPTAPTSTTTTTTTSKPTTTTREITTTEIEPSATTKHTTLSSTASTSPAPAPQHCADNDSVAFTCADMQYFGYCHPNAGSGYALAQMRCRKTCGFCV